MIHVTGIKVTALGIVAGLLISAFGCTANRSSMPIVSAHNVPPGFSSLDHAYWWRCKFRNVWPDDGEADLVIDLLLAHAVVAPVLAAHEADIPYWRFHRRAAPDNTGHQFTFLFYSRPKIASALFAEIGRNEVLKNAMAANLVEKVVMDDPNHPRLPDIEDTSDRRWSSDLQKNWPSFIMGVSSLWLGLIADAMHGSPEDVDDIRLLLGKYREADADITEMWKTEGQHAFLHHLSAVFGYEPMMIKKELLF